MAGGAQKPPLSLVPQLGVVSTPRNDPNGGIDEEEGIWTANSFHGLFGRPSFSPLRPLRLLVRGLDAPSRSQSTFPPPLPSFAFTPFLVTVFVYVSFRLRP